MPYLGAKYNSSGPIVEVYVGVSEPRRRMMMARNIAPPALLRLSLIIDTGATTTMINDQHMRSLGISVRGTRDILTATNDEKPTPCSTYDIGLTIRSYGDAPYVLPALEVLGRPLFNHSIDGMIGRDVLNKLVLTIDGPRMQFRIDY